MYKRIITTMLAILFSSMAMADDLRIGVDPNLKPFVYENAHGELLGFDVEAAKQICQDLDRKCKFVKIEWDGLIPSLMVGKIDVIISSMSITEEREKSVDFTIPFYKSPSQILVLKETKNLEMGDTVGVLRGSTDEAYAKAFFEPAGIKVASYSNQNEAFLDLRATRIAAVLSPRIEAEAFLQGVPDIEYSFIGKMIDDEKYYGPGIGFAVKSGNKALLTDLNRSIIEIHSNPRWIENSNKYFNFNIFDNK